MKKFKLWMWSFGAFFFLSLGIVWLWPKGDSVQVKSISQIPTEELVLALEYAQFETPSTIKLDAALELFKRSNRPDDDVLYPMIREQVMKAFESPEFSDRKAAFMALVNHQDWIKAMPLKSHVIKVAREINQRAGRNVCHVTEKEEDIHITFEFRVPATR